MDHEKKEMAKINRNEAQTFIKPEKRMEFSEEHAQR